jgi:DNA-binding MarR family transcriptional regulator
VNRQILPKFRERRRPMPKSRQTTKTTKADVRYTLAAQAYTHLIREIFRLNGELVIAGNKLGKEFALTTARWQVLGAIAHTPVTVSHIGREMGMARQNVQRIVDLLAEEGIVELLPNPHHRRASLIGLTAVGIKKHRSVSQRQHVWANRIAQGMAAGDIAAAMKVLETLRRRLAEDEL